MFRQIIIGLVILLAGLGIAKFLISSRAQPEEKPRDAVIPLVQAMPLEIKSGYLEVKGTGTIRPREELILSAEVPGKIVYVNPDLREGQRIKAGATLFRIDPTDYVSGIKTAQSNIETSNVAVLQAKEEMALAKAEISLFQNRQASLALSRDTNGQGGASQILPPDILINNANEAAPSAPMSGDFSGLATREPQLRSAEAGLKRAELELENAELALKRTEVKSPFSAVVRSEQIALGSYVAPGQSLGSIIGTNEFEAIISLSEDEAALISGLWEKQKKPITAKVFSNYGSHLYEWPASVDRANNVLNPQTRTIDVFLKISEPLRSGVLTENSEGEKRAAPPLFVGDFVEAAIQGRALEAYATLPTKALGADNRIWLIEDDILRGAQVEIFQRDDKYVLIDIAGLGENPVVVLNPSRTTTQGQQVRVELVADIP